MDHADKTAQRQLKAYVFIEQQTMELSPGLQEPTNIHVDLKNFGQTPAYDITLSGRVAFGKQFDTKVADYSEPMPIPPLGPGAGYRATINAPDGLPAQILGQLRNGTLTMFVYGMVRYSDAFGGHRYLNFRYESGAAAGGAWNALVTCREGNDSDAPD